MAKTVKYSDGLTVHKRHSLQYRVHIGMEYTIASWPTRRGITVKRQRRNASVVPQTARKAAKISQSISGRADGEGFRGVFCGLGFFKRYLLRGLQFGWIKNGRLDLGCAQGTISLVMAIKT